MAYNRSNGAVVREIALNNQRTYIECIPETSQEVIKDPMVLEFLGLERNSAFLCM